MIWRASEPRAAMDSRQCPPGWRPPPSPVEQIGIHQPVEARLGLWPKPIAGESPLHICPRCSLRGGDQEGGGERPEGGGGGRPRRGRRTCPCPPGRPMATSSLCLFVSLSRTLSMSLSLSRTHTHTLPRSLARSLSRSLSLGGDRPGGARRTCPCPPARPWCSPGACAGRASAKQHQIAFV